MPSLPEDQGQGTPPFDPLTAGVLHPICTLEASRSSNTAQRSWFHWSECGLDIVFSKLPRAFP